MGELRPKGFTFTVKYTFIPFVHSVSSYMYIFLPLCGVLSFHLTALIRKFKCFFKSTQHHHVVRNRPHGGRKNKLISSSPCAELPGGFG